jgi:hypothetical protein
MAVGLVLFIPLVAGPLVAFGGVPALAALFRERAQILSPGMHNHLRAIGWMFFVHVPVVVWSLGSIRERSAVFRIVVGLAVVAGLARLTGWIVNGYPGPIATVILCLELGYLPLLLLWHARLVRLQRG